MEKKKNRENVSGPDGALPEQQQEREYQFLNEVIRKKPADRRALAVRIAAIFLSAALFGIVAALCFVGAVRRAGDFPLFGSDSSKISIPEDEDPGHTAGVDEALPASAFSASSSSEETEPAEQEPEETDLPPSAELPVLTELQELPVSQVAELQEPETEGLSQDVLYEAGSLSGQADLPGVETDGEESTDSPEPTLTLQAYRTLFQDMLAVAEDPEHAIVRVTGISSEMDYFRQYYENTSQVSGLAVAENDDSLFVLTEYRAVESVERIMVTFCDGTMADANFLKYDPNTGLAILKVPADSIPEETRDSLRLAPLGNSRVVTRGEPVLALGSPLGYSDSVAYGIITSVTNFVSGIDAQYQLLTTDIEGNHEGSGILVNLSGRVVGIIAQQYGSAENHTVTALAISQIKPLIEKLSNNEPLPWLGVTGQSVTQELAERTGIPKGVLVIGVEQDSPAMLAGIKEYDVIIRVNLTPVNSVQEYQRIVSALQPEEAVEITAMRKGAQGYSEISFSAECGSW